MDRFELTREISAWQLRAAGEDLVILSARDRDEAIALSRRHVMSLTGPSSLRILDASGNVEEEHVFPRSEAKGHRRN